MVSAIWRLAHLTLAIFSFIFLIIASLTGTILAIDAVVEKTTNNYKVDDFDQITLSQTITAVKNNFTEVLELTVDHNQFVTIEGFDEEGNDFKAIINPINGQILGNPIEKSEFIQWITSLHRSLFLHETGRFIVGFVSFLLFLITITGLILIVKRQQSFKNFVGKIHKDYFAQYFHVAAGRFLLVPILIISLTGTYLFLLRFELLNKNKVENFSVELSNKSQENNKKFETFNNIKLEEVSKIEFPFSDDPEEFFKVKLKDKELVIDQFSNEVLHQVDIDNISVIESISLNLHTGKTNVIWALILAIASLNIIAFIYTGFVITLRRKSTKFINIFKLNDADVVILVGSENGSTLNYAQKIHTKLLENKIKSFISDLNSYSVYDNAKHIIIITATYGLGEAPNNAKNFLKLINLIKQKNILQFSVLGFGSTNYDDFCGYAKKVELALINNTNFSQIIPLQTVNNKSTIDIVNWASKINAKTNFNFSLNTADYQLQKPKLTSLKVIDKKEFSCNDTVFMLTLKTSKSFRSGDLLAIYPNENSNERYYSIAKVDGNIQLIVKLHEFGIGSNFLYNKKVGAIIKASIIKNDSFYFPKKSKQVVMIANGTGIAPFLGMIANNTSHTKINLYCGFRYDNELSKEYDFVLNSYKKEGKLTNYQFAFSREQNQCYVIQLIKNDANFVANLLSSGGNIMICGSLAMQKDVEKTLDEICLGNLKTPLIYFKENRQILTDCY